MTVVATPKMNSWGGGDQAPLHLEDFLPRPTNVLFISCGIHPALFAIVMRTDARDDKSFLLRLPMLVKCESLQTGETNSWLLNSKEFSVSNCTAKIWFKHLNALKVSFLFQMSKEAYTINAIV